MGGIRRWRAVVLVSAFACLLAGCNWAMFGYGPGNTRYNPGESKIKTGNAATLKTRWTAGTLAGIDSSPAIVNGVVFVGSDKMYAFDAVTGATLWTAKTSAFVQSSPAVVNGVVYVGADDGRVFAFDAAGNTGCSGAPKTCVPLWTATTGGTIFSSAAVASGVVYVGSYDGSLYAFDAAGNTGCSGTPKTCAPLWTAPTGNLLQSSPAVANGVVYIGSYDHNLYAFDAAGSNGCSGTPKTCAPLWTAPTGSIIESSPAVASGVVYVGSFDHSLYAFDAAGSTGCAGTPKVCAPLWTAPTNDLVVSSPAVAKGVVYVGSDDGSLYAFDAAGSTGCAGTPKVCAPLWTGPTKDLVASSPAVANGVVYVGSFDGRVYAFAAGGCSETPKACPSLWTGTTAAGVQSSPAIVNGVVYVGSFDSRLYAFGLPTIFVTTRSSHVAHSVATGATRSTSEPCVERGNHGIAIGGGFESDDDLVPVTLSQSEATTDGGTAGTDPPDWTVTLTNHGPATSFRWQVVCLNPGSAKPHVVQRAAIGGTTLASGAAGSTTATCQSGEVAIGGGFVATRINDGTVSGAITVGESEATPDGVSDPTAWTAYATNNDTVNVSLSARVTCATASGADGVHVVQRSQSGGITVAQGASDSSIAICQSGEVATGGGFVARRSSDASLERAVALEYTEATLDTFIGPNAWSVILTNNDTVDVNFTARVMCVS